LQAVVEQQRKEIMAVMEAKIEQHRAELATALTPRPPAAAITEAELTALHARLEGLHAAELLADDELHGVEDTIADWSLCEASVVDHVMSQGSSFPSRRYELLDGHYAIITRSSYY
jgi:hypothetical protein